MDNAAWTEILADLGAKDVAANVRAAAALRTRATLQDVPQLLLLLETGDFFVREAAAWPLAELAGPSVLTQLFVAYQRGFDDGHYNDGFSAALIEIPALHGAAATRTLFALAGVADPDISSHAKWLLEFCNAGIA
jgi:HEAT repeat protein